MNIMIEDMNEQIAKDILNWKYDEPYDFYNNDPTDNEEVEELLNGSYYVLVNDLNELVGFFCIGESAQVPRGHQYGVYEDDLIDMGLGMNPTLTGNGNGFEFCSFTVNLIEKIYKGTPIRLTVAKFNQRAIHLYEKLGFVQEKEFDTDLAKFITMVKKPRI